MNQTLIYAHRGASHDAPENTLAAFELAKEQGADGVELDIQLTKDGQIVVIHDDLVDRTTNGSGLVTDLLYSDIQKLDAGAWKDPIFKGQRIPLLEDVCKISKAKNLQLNIEIKPTLRASEIEDKLIALLKTYDMLDLVVVSSFDHYCLKSIKNKFSSIETGILYNCGLIDAGNYAKNVVGADGIHPYKFAVTEECIHSAVSNGLKIRPWTVDDPNMFKYFTSTGHITAAITNQPELMIKTLNS